MGRKKSVWFAPDFGAFVREEECILASQLRAIRATISHPGEKGRSVERSVAGVFRGLLPSEYGIATGFMVCHPQGCVVGQYPKQQYDSSEDGRHLSTQADILLYDALRCGPIVSLPACDIVPLEGLYAYVEVKTQLARSNLDDTVRQTKTFRDQQTRFYHGRVADNPVGSHLLACNDYMSVRSYVFALDAAASLGSTERFRARLETSLRRNGGFLSAMYVQGVGCFYSHRARNTDDPDLGRVRAIEPAAALSAFKNLVYHGLSRFPRHPADWTPAIDTYQQLTPPNHFFACK